MPIILNKSITVSIICRITFILMISSTILDYALPAQVVKKFGVYETTFGLIMGLFSPPIGLVLGSFIGELIYNYQDKKGV